MSHSAFQCVRGTKSRHTILHSRVGLMRFDKKRAGTRYVELVFLHPVGSVSHVLHFGASDP
jgi:hypothetical protein